MEQRRDRIRNRNMLLQAELTLLLRKKREQITTQEVLKTANLSHGTFYAYYRNLDDLHAQAEQMIAEEIRLILSHADGLRAETYFRAFEPYREKIRTLSACGNLLWFAELVKNEIAKLLRQTLPDTQIPACHWIAGTLTDALLNWLTADAAWNPEPLLTELQAYLSGGVHALTDAQTDPIENSK